MHSTTYDDAKDRSLVVSESSILDFVTSGHHFSPPKATLNEHFRSLPQLASFTSDTFYKEDGGLRLMKEVPKHLHKQCFCAVQVGGQREPENRIVPAEVEALLTRLRYLICKRGYLTDPQLQPHGFDESDKNRPTIGVLSFLTDQRNYIRARIEEQFTPDECAAHELMVGTTEDFQGNERNIMFITFGLDGTRNWAKSFFENPNRFNVATSRAINFTYAIIGRVPETSKLIKSYLRHFGVSWTTVPVEGEEQVENPVSQRYAWRYHPESRESEFEIRVDDYLHEFIQAHGGTDCIQLFNQVVSCGQKRLDFVLFNRANGECCAVEVDGQDHFTVDGRSYCEAHLDRVAVLKRAGWQIVHVPYYHWYRDGWLCDSGNEQFQRYVESLYGELRDNLRIPR